MGWGSNPRFKISRRTLSFAEAHKIFSDDAYWHRNHTGANIHDAPPGRSHYWIVCGHERNPTTEKYETCYRFLMYQTHIHTWWEDGTYQSRYYNSPETRDALSAFGPVRVWSNSRGVFIDKDRFGIPPWGYNADTDKHYPYGSGITVDPDGFVRDVTDHKYVLKPTARKERNAIRTEFRDRATARILLGEFDHPFAEYHGTSIFKGFGRRHDNGWVALVPSVHSNIARLLLEGAPHNVIEERMESSRGSWRQGPVRDTREQAMLAAIETMATEYINSLGDWYEQQPISYGDINVRDL